MLDKIKLWFHNHMRGIKFLILFIYLAVVLYIFPHPEYTLLFVLFGGILAYLVIYTLVARKNIGYVDFEHGEMAVYEISDRQLNEFQMVDEKKQPSAIRFSLKTSGGSIAFVSLVNIKDKLLQIHPVFADIEILNKTRTWLVNNKKKMEQLYTDNINEVDNREILALEYVSKAIKKQAILDNMTAGLENNVQEMESNAQKMEASKDAEKEVVTDDRTESSDGQQDS